ncbi:MAG: rRNA maturation RNase YbeY [Chloroflexota bacterium]|nr:rRNA maturation RNase YbeY [Chloroflexota bacterium]
MEINVLVVKGVAANVEAGWLQRVAEQVLTAQNISPSAELSLVLTTPKKIRELNRDYLGEDSPTDVLSFPMEPESSAFVMPPDGKLHLGEVIISYSQAAAQAREHQHSVKKELVILLIHGVLHVLGFDHAQPDEERRMRAREAEILGQVEGLD